MIDEARGRTFQHGEFVVYEALMAGLPHEEAYRRRDDATSTGADTAADVGTDVGGELTWDQWFRQEGRDPRSETFNPPTGSPSNPPGAHR